MKRTILAVVAVMAVGCGGESGDGVAAEEQQPPVEWTERDPDAAQLDTSCPTPAVVIRLRTMRDYPETTVECPPVAASWWSGVRDPSIPFREQMDLILHCEWRCVPYACAEGQDVRIDYGTDSRIVAIVSGPSAHCESLASPPLVAR